ncbi:hypothetical protein CLV35_1129 [Motilibacter peucedani]|uniref:PKD domain-containing protein n=1 Tax=Motilibacter peucedani TaxID=598650 RepID=A0A420XRA7_9ACTN|nr:PKD domain-containing protein [Motilibacter peucedani]RKS77443.1 hypothetical protein CLV35_1129 [Motilibacter peucedani]
MPRYYNRVAFTQACGGNTPGGTDAGCANSTGSCTAPQLMMYRWLQQVDRLNPALENPWIIGGEECRTPGDKPRASLTDIYSAFRRLPVARGVLHAQPAGRTLVGLDTVFYTEAVPRSFPDVDLVVERIDFVATPVQFVWHFGDGTSSTSSDPGAAYPHQTVTHAYRAAGVTHEPSVTVVWAGKFKRQDESTWHEVPDRVEAAGTPVSLAVASARSVLVEDPD